MYFPWIGFLEQLRLADVFVIYDDVQFSKGSFTNRVQIKTSNGNRWMTVPLPGLHLGQAINQIRLDSNNKWPGQHRDLLWQAYKKAPFVDDMLALFDGVFSGNAETLSELAHASTMALVSYFEIANHLHFIDAKKTGISGKSSQRVLDIVSALSGKVYITGHGARNYLDHNAFEQAGISVQYMDYRLQPYPQLHGNFTPYVSALDLAANCGKQGVQYIQSNTIEWKKFIHDPS